MDLHRVTGTDVPWREGAGCSRTAKHTPPIRPADPVTNGQASPSDSPVPTTSRTAAPLARSSGASPPGHPADRMRRQFAPALAACIVSAAIAWWTPTAHAQEDQTPPTLREISTTTTGALIPLSYDENLLD